MRIRRFRDSDAVKASNCARKALFEISSRYYPKRIINSVMKHYSPASLKKKSRKMLILVAAEGSKILGTAGFDDGWILGVFVDPKYHGKEIGTKLLKRIENIAKERGFEKIRTHAAVNSIGFYKKNGFRVVKPAYFKDAGKVYRMIKRIK